MRDGFAIVVTPGGYAPYVRIGWVVRQDDWVGLYNCRVIRRFGTSKQLSQLAETGPIANTETLNLIPEDGCHVGQIVRWLPADPTKWPTCPEPAQ